MFSRKNNLNLFFQILSYSVVFSGFFSLWISGTFEILGTVFFIALFTGAWFLENSRWQISERLGTVFIVLALPLFYAAWKLRLFGFSSNEAMLAGILARLILTLTVIKLLQEKSDRDWVFLYIMAFFEVLLAAALSISALYLASFLLFSLVIIATIIVFEIRKTSRGIGDKTFEKFSHPKSNELMSVSALPIKKLVLTSISLIFLIILIAAPMFFLLPRVGGAGLGGNQNSASTLTGFSDRVSLGEIGKIQQNDQVAMRVRLESFKNIANPRWRGVALDYFDNKIWSRSLKNVKERFDRDDRGVIQLSFAEDREDIAIQTVYLEPMDSQILFAMSKPISVQGNFPTLLKDSEGGIQFFRGNYERISYKVYSDTNLPETSELRTDKTAYTPQQQEKYLQLPSDLDERISQLAGQISQGQNNRYDKAKAIETYLQTQFGYTLEQKATGDQPVADFLFNVREGHCEYFATAMTLMLRTQGIAARVVNGFQTGDYNQTAEVFVVKQRNAHSWVEVYFPQKNAWITFDPTPFSGQTVGNDSSTGIAAMFGNYLEALETFWIQYFVAYDNQEQQSLMRSLRNGFVDFQVKASDWASEKQNQLSDWWQEVRGEKGFEASVAAIGYGIVYICATILGVILVIWLYRKIKKLKIWLKIYVWLKQKKQKSIVEFYERMQKVLENKGFVRPPHQTPLEFAYTLDISEAVKITEKYNRVRFGEANLENNEAAEIEMWLKDLEEKEFKK